MSEARDIDTVAPCTPRVSWQRSASQQGALNPPKVMRLSGL
jgi:hypothetical protein